MTKLSLEASGGAHKLWVVGAAFVAELFYELDFSFFLSKKKDN